MHQHEHEHSHSHEDNLVHSHEHSHTHEHETDSGHDHEHELLHASQAEHSHTHDAHQHGIQSAEEAAAFIRYTLHHNAHHVAELSELAHCLEHLELDGAAFEVRLCLDEIENANGRLEKVLIMLGK